MLTTNNDMKALWEEASVYGRVRLTTSDDKTYYCNIEFHTHDHIELKASSNFNCKTPEEALTEAIIKAEKVKDGLSTVGRRLEDKLKKFAEGS